MSAKHGTRSKYVSGCKCARCVQANRIYQREYLRARRRAGVVDSHGRLLDRSQLD